VYKGQYIFFNGALVGMCKFISVNNLDSEVTLVERLYVILYMRLCGSRTLCNEQIKINPTFVGVFIPRNKKPCISPCLKSKNGHISLKIYETTTCRNPLQV
jgi:hypothetical protein